MLPPTLRSRLQRQIDADFSGLEAARWEIAGRGASPVGQLGVVFVPALIGAGVVGAGWLSSWVSGALARASDRRAYLACVEDALGRGMSPETAATLCGGESGGAQSALLWVGVGLGGAALLLILLNRRKRR